MTMKKRFLAFIFLIAFVLSLGVCSNPLPAAAYASSPDGLNNYWTYYIKSDRSGKYLEIENSSPNENALVQQNDFTGADNQKWTITHMGYNEYKITSVLYPNKALTVVGNFETPGGAILYFAHNYLETLCLDKYTAHKKDELSVTFADLVYNGQWFTPLREALSAFVDKTQENVTGKVRIKLYKGNMIKAGAWSDYSLYSEEIATFGEDHVYNQADATGFINLFGLPIKVQAQVNQANKKKSK